MIFYQTQNYNIQPTSKFFAMWVSSFWLWFFNKHGGLLFQYTGVWSWSKLLAKDKSIPKFYQLTSYGSAVQPCF